VAAPHSRRLTAVPTDSWQSRQEHVQAAGNGGRDVQISIFAGIPYLITTFSELLTAFLISRTVNRSSPQDFNEKKI
jgi:hypothetical protein